MAGFFDRVGRFIDDVLLLPDDLRLELELGEAELEAKRWGDAARRFEKVLALRPSLVRAWTDLAMAREGLNDVAAARDALAKGRALEPDDPGMALWAARLAWRAADVEGAIEAARDALRRLPREDGASIAEACAIRARAEWRRGRPDRAARELRKALAATPDDVPMRVELAEALVESGNPGAARAVAANLDGTALDDALATRVGIALDRAGAGVAAAPWLERGANAGDPRALVALARRALAAGDLDRAEEQARRAVARGGGWPALVALGEVARAEGRAAEAAEAFAHAAAARGGDPALLREAARTAPLDDPNALIRHADALDRAAPGDPAALAARAWSALTRRDYPTAHRLLSDGASQTPEARLLLARAKLALLEARARDSLAALDALRDVAGSDAALAEQLRRESLRALWKPAVGEVDLAGAIDAVSRFGAERDLPSVEKSAAVLREELDRPLLLAILGEFNAGKSTLINAFVGADVAPTGILPTTATLNILRGGAERRVRVVFKDGTTREGPYESLKELLADADRGTDEGRVDHVEIVLPSEVLERVWILDTPGTNAIDPDHERLAREAARRADAAIWIFHAGQAGKASEGKMLAELRGSRRVVVPVINKVDRLSAEERTQVIAALEAELPDLARDPVPIAARVALRARLAGDDAAYAESGFPAFLDRLEREVFSRSRVLKRAACAGRLLAILDGALASEAAATAEHESRAAALEAAAGPLAVAAAQLPPALDEALGALLDAQSAAFREAAQEVLAFVRPRTNRFAQHGTDPEDRAFLGEVIERRLAHAITSTEWALVTRAIEILGADPDRVRAHLAPPFAAFRGYQRGLIDGGALRRFFDEVLPRAELAPHPLAAALAAARADPKEHLRPALLAAADGLVAALEAERARDLAAVRAHRLALGWRVYGPLRALREVLAELL